MRFTKSAILASFATAASAAVMPEARVSCSEATRFGVVTVVPSTLSPGDSFTVHADFTCAISNYGINPQYTDYYIEVPENNNGHEPPILVARRTLTSPPTDTFTAQLPYAYYFANTSYSLVLDTTYAINGTNGTPYSVVGGIETLIDIINIS
ncbi:hypothetical protein BJ138DRAFT_1141332 [Hygrophoropsis aurantiaca]|uniref:Uncharacterized protein n=1 Tax=Hygrophoropsis aurantiaca TaxID=72124 RepID=A0ACB8ARR7_9AGAM|nr:hypothetical protein BJ138DRAFT_1141332 [Hygrophoropsis aurantiaca]